MRCCGIADRAGRRGLIVESGKLRFQNRRAAHRNGAVRQAGSVTIFARASLERSGIEKNLVRITTINAIRNGGFLDTVSCAISPLSRRHANAGEAKIACVECGRIVRSRTGYPGGTHTCFQLPFTGPRAACPAGCARIDMTMA
jgi:hypothetical protein